MVKLFLKRGGDATLIELMVEAVDMGFEARGVDDSPLRGAYGRTRRKWLASLGKDEIQVDVQLLRTEDRLFQRVVPHPTAFGSTRFLGIFGIQASVRMSDLDTRWSASTR